MFEKVLIANRGEIALRLVRALRDVGAASVVVYAQDDGEGPHLALADQALALNASGVEAYLDIEALVQLALEHRCDAIHPGYGFLSERADFARACERSGVVFIGPRSEHVEVLGNKAAARALAQQQQVPVLAGTDAGISLAEAQQFLAQQLAQGHAMVLKAVAGGGGRGMRVVRDPAHLEAAYQRCQSEALKAFGLADVYAERLIERARHIEIQVLGDGQHQVSLGERECSLQRRFQKLVEIAPSPWLSEPLRLAMSEAALRMATAMAYTGLVTFEFLVDDSDAATPWVFMEANPRLQVEHTVTEQVSGLDVVQLQLEVASGRRVNELGLARIAPRAKGYAVQWRINAEQLVADGSSLPAAGRLERFDMPAGGAIRIDSAAQVGAKVSPHYDSLLAKLIVSSHSDNFEDVCRRSRRALAECHISGISTNLKLLQALAQHEAFVSQQVHTRFVETTPWQLQLEAAPKAPTVEAPDAQWWVTSPMTAKLVALEVTLGQHVAAGQVLAVLEAMKMEHVVVAERSAEVLTLAAHSGDNIQHGQGLVLLAPLAQGLVSAASSSVVDLDAIPPSLQRVIDRHSFTLDQNRAEAVAKRHASGGRTARENIAQLCDEGSFIEYGALAIAAQSRRRSLEDLIANTPADGMVTGIGTVNAADFGPDRSRCVAMAYDYTVLAGTQGYRNHQKTERMLALALKLQLPLVLWAEGGGGRPGDVDKNIIAGLNNHTFSQYAALSGQVPVIGIAHGRCFAGNAALLGCSDVVIATEHSYIGMSGPAMIEGGGLGVYRPEHIGPSSVQRANGVIDVVVADELAAAEAARRYLSYFQGTLAQWDCADQRLLRQVVPENRLRVYDVRRVIELLADTGSVLELRRDYGCGLITALARLEGRAVGLIANNPQHLGGAIDPEAADKSSRFMQLCEAHGLPIVSLVDTPGFMVGPDTEAQAQVRHACRMFVIGAHLSVPFLAVVLRKGYGLGAQAMTAGGFDAPVFTVSWPSGEFGPMGLEGAVSLGYRKELAAEPAGQRRQQLFEQLLAQQYRNGEALHMAQDLEIDAVIDPQQTRSWLLRGLASAHHQPRQSKRRFVDTW